MELLSRKYNLRIAIYHVGKQKKFVPELGNTVIDEKKSSGGVTVALAHMQLHPQGGLIHYDALLINPTPEQVKNAQKISQKSQDTYLESDNNNESVKQQVPSKVAPHSALYSPKKLERSLKKEDKEDKNNFDL